MRLRRGPDVAIFHEFQPPPYGGSNQFLLALKKELERRGIRVEPNRIGRRTRACILNAFAFDHDALRRQLHDGVRVVHRVDGPVGTYRGQDDGTDDVIAALNAEFADTTVFQSQYSVDAHRALGYAFVDPRVVPNTVDTSIFHPPAHTEPRGGRKLRLISTSWSDNPNKGAPDYRRLEGLLDWSRYEYTFAGRSPVELERVRMLPPLDSQALADELRRHDVYVTASRNDPCSNALLEALACGLPALYLRSGGHPELVGDAGFGFDDVAEVPGLLTRLEAEYDERRARIALLSLAEVADRYVDALGLASSDSYMAT